MKLPDDVDREFLYQVLLAREALGSTGIGDGIAIPHVRNPIVLHLSRPTVTLCFLEQPVDFGALDGQPVSDAVHADQPDRAGAPAPAVAPRIRAPRPAIQGGGPDAGLPRRDLRRACTQPKPR